MRMKSTIITFGNDSKQSNFKKYSDIIMAQKLKNWQDGFNACQNTFWFEYPRENSGRTKEKKLVLYHSLIPSKLLTAI